MLDFFDWIVAFFENIGQILYNSVENIINIFGVLLTYQSVPSILGAYTPWFLSVSVFIVTAVGITKLILGWGNS